MNSNLASHNFLCQIISPFCDTRDIVRLKNKITRSEVSWERVIHFANTHLIISALWVGLCEKRLDLELENEVRNYLQELHTLNLKRNQGLKRQAVEAIEALNQIGIVPMLIKGAVQLFQPIHKDFGVRIMVDLDILVPRNRIAEAIKALTQIGYRRQEYSNSELAPPHHMAPMFRSGEYGSIELHFTALGNRIANHILPTAEILAIAEEYNTAEVCFKVPNSTHSVLLEILHSQLTHRHHQRLSLDYKALHDMVTLISRQDRNIDWHQIQNRFAKHGMNSILRTHLWMAHRLLNLPVRNGIEPNAFTRSYHGLYLAMICWKLLYSWYNRALTFYNVRIMKRFGLLKLWSFEADSAIPD